MCFGREYRAVRMFTYYRQGSWGSIVRLVAGAVGCGVTDKLGNMKELGVYIVKRT